MNIWQFCFIIYLHGLPFFILSMWYFSNYFLESKYVFEKVLKRVFYDGVKYMCWQNNDLKELSYANK